MADVRIEDHSDEYMDLFDSAMDRALEAIGIQIEGEAKEELENSPRRVDTGLLRNSITYALDGEAPKTQTYSADNQSKYGNRKVTEGSYSGNAPKEPRGRSVIIGSNVEYAAYVHEGHTTAGGKTISPNRFLKNAVSRNKNQINQYLKDALG